MYQYKDHLGNIRLSYGFDQAAEVLKVIEENHYYPYGLKHTRYNTGEKKYQPSNDDPAVTTIKDLVANGMPTNKYKYNGKEYQDELGLNMYDYGARNYDPAAPRFWQMDPLAEFYYEFSPYNYVGSNPIIRTDPTGMDWYTDKDGNYKYNKDLNKDNADSFFKDNKIDGTYFGTSGTREVYTVDANGNKLETLSKHSMNADGSVTDLLSGELTEDGSGVDSGSKTITSNDNLPSIYDYKNGESFSSVSGKNYTLIDKEWVQLSGNLVPPSQIAGFTAPVAVSFPKESWIDSNIVKHINRKNLEGSVDARGTALGFVGQMLAEGKVSLPSLMTISVTLFFNYTTSNYDRIEENKAHDKEVDKSRNNK